MRVALEVQRRSRTPVGSMTVRLTVGKLGDVLVPDAGTRRRAGARAESTLGPLPRGVFELSDPRVVFGDLLGLVTVAPRVLCDPATLVVRPRLDRARRPLLGRRPGCGRRTADPPASRGRLRLPLGARVRAGRVAAPCALADERAPRPAHGEGARGHGTRRRRGDPRLRSAPCRRRRRRTRASTPRFESPDRSCRRTPCADAPSRSSRREARAPSFPCALQRRTSTAP